MVLPRYPQLARQLRGSPHIVVEVLSPGPEARERDLGAKRTLYWRREVVEYWVIDVEARVLVRMMTRGPSGWSDETLEDADVVQTPLLPGWAGVRVADLLP